MRILQLIVTGLFVLTFALGLVSMIGDRRDTTIPTLTLDSDEIHISVNDSAEILLSGVSASDRKDGDLTDRVIIESVSRFLRPGVSKVTYAVWDNDDHVVKASRKVIYDDYTEPEFYLNRSLIFGTSQSVNITKCLGAYDVMDGDISDRVIITSTDYQAGSSDVFYIQARVTNSKGGSASLELPVFIEERNIAAPVITLESYLRYIPVGGTFDAAGNLFGAYTSGGGGITPSVRVDTDLDTNVPGVYLVHYYVTDSDGRTTHEIAAVVVEGGEQ